MRKWIFVVGIMAATFIGCAQPGPGTNTNDNLPTNTNDNTTPDGNSFSRGLNFTDPQVYESIQTYRPALTFGAGGLPDKVDLTTTNKFPDPGNQGSQGSCTAWACAYAVKTYQEAVEGQYSPSSFEQIFSPSFVYYFTNNAQGDPNRCINAAVSTIKTVMDLLKTRGAATLATMSYNETICASPPSQAALDEAKNYTIRDYARLTTKNEVRRSLSEGNPVIIGIVVGETFMEAGGEEWTLQDYQADLSDPAAGGHAFVIVGYDDSAQRFKVMNSWGLNWGENGFWYISYEAIDYASQLLSQGATLFELWVTWDNTSDAPVSPEAVVEDPDAPLPGSDLIALSNVQFADASDEDAGIEGLGVFFDLTLSEQLEGQEITLALAIIDEGTGELLIDRDGDYAYDGFVAAAGSIYVSGVYAFTDLVLFLPYEEFDLARGSYTLSAVLLAGNEDDSQSAVFFQEEPFAYEAETSQFDDSVPTGEYTGEDNDGWYLDFYVEGDGSVWGFLSHPTRPFFFETTESGITQEGDAYMAFDLAGFADGVTCEYLGGFTSPDGGEGIWTCSDGANGTWTFATWDRYLDFDYYEDYDDWDEDYDFFEDDWDYYDAFDDEDFDDEDFDEDFFDDEDVDLP